MERNILIDDGANVFGKSENGKAGDPFLNTDDKYHLWTAPEVQIHLETFWSPIYPFSMDLETQKTLTMPGLEYVECSLQWQQWI